MSFFNPKNPKSKIVVSLVMATFITGISCQPHGFLVIAIPIIIMLIWIPYSVYVIIRKPDLRVNQLSRVGIWIVAVFIVTGFHFELAKSTKRSADEIVLAIDNYTKKFGHCPAQLEDLGLNRTQLKAKLGMSGYYCNNGKPSLFYVSTYTIGDTNVYNFEKKVWEYQPD